MNGFDLSTISGCYTGSSPASAIYLGNTQIWSSGGGTDYSTRYLTFEALESGTFAFSDNSIEYSIDGGSTWVSLAADTDTPTVAAGNKIMWKKLFTEPSTATYAQGIGMFSSTGRFNVEGNVMSLIYGDNFIGQTDMSALNYKFVALFGNCAYLVSAENLVLPATILPDYSYVYMFTGCSILVTPPSNLPSMTLTDSCYMAMFANCPCLTSAPTLPATTLYSDCYNSMFSNCSALEIAPALPALTLADNCYGYMFYRCTSLIDIKMMATDISATNCLNNWTHGVGSDGTFTKNILMESLPRGDSGIPQGWAVIGCST